MNKKTQAARDKMVEEYGGKTHHLAYRDGWDACYNYLKETGQLKEDVASEAITNKQEEQ